MDLYESKQHNILLEALGTELKKIVYLSYLRLRIYLLFRAIIPQLTRSRRHFARRTQRTIRKPHTSPVYNATAGKSIRPNSPLSPYKHHFGRHMCGVNYSGNVRNEIERKPYAHGVLVYVCV